MATTALPPPRTAPRCDYCNRPAAEGLRFRGYLSACLRRRQPTIIKGACAEHRTCLNWTSMLALLRSDMPNLQVRAYS